MGGDSCLAQSPALPNIIGRTSRAYGNSSAKLLVADEAQGAFKTVTTSGSKYIEQTTYSSSNFLDYDDFDASLSNEIYGKSDKVLPESFALIAQIKY